MEVFDSQKHCPECKAPATETDKPQPWDYRQFVTEDEKFWIRHQLACTRCPARWVVDVDKHINPQW